MRDAGKGLRGVVHSFSGGPADLEQVLALGLHVALGGIVTFEKGTDGLREAAKLVPADRLLLETDAPYLTPVPRRGQRNTPSEVRTVAEFVAQLRGEPLEQLATTTTANARKLFNLNG
jgi:TatD DNase family protein